MFYDRVNCNGALVPAASPSSGGDGNGGVGLGRRERLGFGAQLRAGVDPDRCGERGAQARECRRPHVVVDDDMWAAAPVVGSVFFAISGPHYL